jgi:hypothetical protein
MFLLLAIISPAYGMNLSVSPENPYVGDDIILKGDTAVPNQILQPSVTFGKTVGVTNGNYDYSLAGIKIPAGENNFVVTSKNVKDLYVGIVMLIKWSKKENAVNGVATISQANVPNGTYTIDIYGTAEDGATSVPLTITASTKINADAQGNFSSIYPTSGIPAGTFNLTVGSITRTITLRERPAPSTGSSEGGTYPTVTQTTRPTSTPVVTPTEAVISGTPETTSTPVETAASTPTATGSKSTTPGFEIGFAFNALALMFILKRKIV